MKERNKKSHICGSKPSIKICMKMLTWQVFLDVCLANAVVQPCCTTNLGRQHYLVGTLFRIACNTYLLELLLPCFPENNTPLILIFTPKFTLGLVFGDVLFWYIKKWSYKVKIRRFLNKQKLRKTINIYLSLTCLLFRNSLTIFSKTIISSSCGMSCWSSVSTIPAEFALNSISHQSARAYFKGRAYIKIILENHARSYYLVRLIIGEAR